MRRYREVLGMTNMLTPPDSPSWSLSQGDQLDMRTGNSQFTPAHPEEQESIDEPKKNL